MRVINPRGQLAEAIQKEVGDQQVPDVDIYCSWNFLDKSEEVQHRCFSKFVEFCMESLDRKIIFISTKCATYTGYTRFKKYAEIFLRDHVKQWGVFRLPNLVGRGVCDKLITGAEPYGVIELLSIEQAARFILDNLHVHNEVSTATGCMVSAEVVKSLLQYGYAKGGRV